MLEVHAIHTFYGHVEAIKGVSLQITKGEFVTLIGANGAGKTTLLKSIIGIEPVTRGIIHFNGEQISGLRADQIIKKGISIVPEGRRVFPDFTVEENLVIGAHARKSTSNEMNDDIEKILTLFPRLKERWRQKCGTMSGGEQQMVAIGRALMARPQLLLLDEPSLGLAPLVVQELMENLKLIHQQGTTLLLVEQNVNLALQIAERGYVLETGEIILTDQSQHLRTNTLIQKSYLGMDA